MSAIITDLVIGVVETLRGKGDKLTAKGVAEAVAERVEETIVTAIAVELQKVAGQLGIVLATHEVAEAAQKVLAAMKAAESRGGLVGRVLDGVQIEIAGPDETLVDGVWVKKP